MSNRKKSQAAGKRGLVAAGEMLRLGLEDIPAKSREWIAEMIREGSFFEVTYSGILGKDHHVRIEMIGPDGVSREMLRIQLV